MSTTATQTQGLKLYDIPDRIRELEQRIIDAGGELTPEIEAEMDALDEAFERKVEFIALLSREAKAEAVVALQEEQRFKNRRTAAENREARLKDYLHACLTKAGLQRVEGQRVKVRVQTNSRPSIWWSKPGEEIPEPYRRVKVEADGTALYESWKADEALPDGFVVELGSHAVIW